MNIYYVAGHTLLHVAITHALLGVYRIVCYTCVVLNHVLCVFRTLYFLYFRMWSCVCGVLLCYAACVPGYFRGSLSLSLIFSSFSYSMHFSSLSIMCTLCVKTVSV